MACIHVLRFVLLDCDEEFIYQLIAEWKDANMVLKSLKLALFIPTAANEE